MEESSSCIKRICYCCGSDRTYIDKTGRHHWRLNPPTDLVLCKKCYNRLIDDPYWNSINAPKYNKINAVGIYPRRITFKGKRILMKEKPRKDKCSWCGAIKGIDCIRTSMHHLIYHEDDPLKDTVELCNRCHTTEHERLKKLKH